MPSMLSVTMYPSLLEFGTARKRDESTQRNIIFNETEGKYMSGDEAWGFSSVGIYWNNDDGLSLPWKSTEINIDFEIEHGDGRSVAC